MKFAMLVISIGLAGLVQFMVCAYLLHICICVLLYTVIYITVICTGCCTDIQIIMTGCLACRGTRAVKQGWSILSYSYVMIGY